MHTVFIAGSGTEVGKTFVTSLLCRQLLAAGRRPATLKPVVSGYTDDEAEGSDPGRLLAALGRPADPEEIARISPWRFEAPVSPDMAARRENRCIDYAAVLEFCRAEAKGGAGDILLIEGIGCLRSPITGRQTVIDWISDLAVPVLLVGGTYLGTISHTLAAAYCVRQRGLRLLGVVLSESPESPVPIAESAETVGRFLPDIPVIALPRHCGGATLPDLTKLLQH
jgi:dethiobiotin synthetase